MLTLTFFFVVVGFAAIVLVGLAVRAYRHRRIWAQPSLPASATEGQQFEDPAAGGSTAGAETNTTDAWAVAQAASRTTHNVMGGGL